LLAQEKLRAFSRPWLTPAQQSPPECDERITTINTIRLKKTLFHDEHSSRITREFTATNHSYVNSTIWGRSGKMVWKNFLAPAILM
jgi:hypothetical protein